MRRLQLKIFLQLGLVLGVAIGIAWLALARAPGREDRMSARLAFTLAAAAALAWAGSRTLARLALEPIEDVADLARRIERGDLDARLLWQHHDERDAMAGAFNRMADHLQQQLDSTRRLLQQREAVMAEMVEGVLVLDEDDRIVLVNEAFRELFDAYRDVEARPVVEVVRLPALGALLARAREATTPVFDDVEIRGHPARIVFCHAARFPTEGPRAGTLAVFHDVTELRRVDRVRRDFIANASHELRTPLTSIQGYAESLASGPMTPDEVETHVGVIQRNVHRMRDLIDDLMDLSRIESGGGAREPVAVDVVRLTQTLLADARPRLAHAKLEARLATASAPPAFADRMALEQVLENLLSNAIRYSDEGGRIEIAIETRAEQLEVSVSDTGIGIPEEALDRIFERFYRVDAARSRAIGSTGLGLAIVRHLVHAMGGTIRVESRLGEGSRFTFSLPRAAAPGDSPS